MNAFPVARDGESPEILALAVALVTGTRADVDPVEIGLMVKNGLFELAQGDRDHMESLMASLTGLLGLMLAEVCDRWSAAAGGDPAGAWLAALGTSAADAR